MLVPERMEHFGFASTCGVETLPETILPADRCLSRAVLLQEIEGDCISLAFLSRISLRDVIL